ncbi:MAG: hypothetical protein KIT17_22310, partial [Rubrivivax sp.]|nr:hypothetical protein [Rubrivivax sp.]
MIIFISGVLFFRKATTNKDRASPRAPTGCSHAAFFDSRRRLRAGSSGQTPGAAPPLREGGTRGVATGPRRWHRR